MILTTERLILRPWEEADAEILFEYAKDDRVGPITGWNTHKSPEESLEVIRNILSKPETYAVCLKEDGKPIGDISIMTGEDGNLPLGEKEAELGFWLGVPYWGRGIIPEAVRECTRHAFLDMGMETLWCCYFDGNDKSRRVQEKCGFTYHHTNEDVYLRLLDEHRREHVTRLAKEDWLKFTNKNN